MSTLLLAAISMPLALLGFHIFTCVLAGIRARAAAPVRSFFEPTSIVVPIAGLSPGEMDCALSALPLASPTVEIIYCAYSEAEPAIAVLRRRLAISPVDNVRILVGRSRQSRNPKLDNIEKALEVIQSKLVIFVDGNIRIPADFVLRLQAEWRADTGAVSSPPLGVDAGNFNAEVEGAMLNTMFARYLLAADCIGAGFIQGKVFMMRRSFLALQGGIKALHGEPVEDGAATRLVRAAKLKVSLTPRLFEQPLGRRRWGDVWHRNLRWAQQRRHSYPIPFAFEPLITAIPAVAMTVFMAACCGLSVLPWTIAMVASWYGTEAVLAALLGWPVNLRFFAAAAVRDAMMIAAWITAWLKTSYVWRGQAVDLSASSIDG